MADPLLVAIRLALFAILMATVGLAAFNLYALNRIERERDVAFDARILFRVITLLGTIASVIGMLMVAAAMDGVSIVSVRAEMIWMLVTETEIGAAGLVRVGALIIALLLCLTDKLTLTALSASIGLLACIALASLVWTGHAGATEGTVGARHRVSDIVHMIAAALWLGGIAAFAVMLRAPADGLWGDRLKTAHRSLDHFARVGTVSVALIIVTGLINSFILVGPERLALLFTTTYGQLLLGKVGLVGLMLALAAQNRWRLTPQLGIGLEMGDTVDAVTALRKSMAMEGAAALLILGLVAWLGQLEPPAGMTMH